MKRGTKIFLSVCGIMAAVGLVVSIVGVSLGATREGLIYSLNRYGSIGPMKFGTSSLGYESDDDWDSDDQFEEITAISGERTFKNVSSLAIDCTYGAVDIVTYEGSDIKVAEGSGRGTVSCEFDNEDKELEIEVKARKRVWLNNNSGKSVRVYIPKGYRFNQVSMEVDAGAINTEALETGLLDVEVGAGESVMEGIKTDNLKAEVGAGRLEIYGTVSRAGYIHGGVGEVDVVLTNSLTEFDYSLKYGIGELVLGHESYGGIGGQKSINNNTGKPFEVEVGVGSVSVTFE
ncbi:hypothetical protein M2146_001358 [Lachnospiraceae bacterium PF1-22]|uniref:DUF4097 family beta strand repeat-containing protein n=1 Tax=Ohessyouella blattaphilus TaxID=2949333 RepID=UPI003E325483